MRIKKSNDFTARTSSKNPIKITMDSIISKEKKNARRASSFNSFGNFNTIENFILTRVHAGNFGEFDDTILTIVH